MNMKHLLNMGNQYYFDQHSGTVYKDREKVGSVTGIKSVILVYLLTHTRTGFIDKDELIKATWHKSDLVVTRSSLAQQIYLLRKNLSGMGINDYIISRSKAGYKIAVYIPPEQDEQNLLESSPLVQYKANAPSSTIAGLTLILFVILACVMAVLWVYR